MKNTILISSAILALVFASCSSSTKTDNKDAKVQNADSTQVFNLDTTKLAAGATYYQCPMDPEEISDKPGICPKCGMDLEAVVKK